MSKELELLTEYIRDDLGYSGDLTPDTDLLEEQILDSFSIVQMAVHIQEVFGLELEPDDLVRDNLAKLSSMVALIEKRRG